jgi:hypothetical protein
MTFDINNAPEPSKLEVGDAFGGAVADTFAQIREKQKMNVPRGTVVVPEGMLKVAMDDSGSQVEHDGFLVELALQAALCWLSENPMVPNEDQVIAILDDSKFNGCSNEAIDVAQYVSEEWQRRMFLPPKPEVPEAIKDKLWESLVGTPLNSSITLGIAKDHDEDVLEAFRRGQNSKRTT